ncbi:MAG TPA: hypothetical protein VFM46_03450, partial [Pseudomonadales bacterium]|nr:hypothetical protein [Pseudomonadales bacterium]
ASAPLQRPVAKEALLVGKIQQVKQSLQQIEMPTLEMTKFYWSEWRKSDLGNWHWSGKNAALLERLKSWGFDYASFFKAFFFVVAFFAMGFGGWFGYQQYLQYKKIQDWLTLADSRYQQNKLTTPADDNAQFYYRQILLLDPENKSAQQGLDKLVVRFTELASAAKDKKDYDKALDYIERGLAVNGSDEALEQMKMDIQAAQAAQAAAAQQTGSVTAGGSTTRSGSRSRRVNGFEQFLHNLFGR